MVSASSPNPTTQNLPTSDVNFGTGMNKSALNVQQDSPSMLMENVSLSLTTAKNMPFQAPVPYATKDTT